MSPAGLRVAHLETGRHLYGGARQVLYLLDGLAERGVENLLLAPAGSAIVQAAQGHHPVVELPIRGELDIGLVLRLRGRLRRFQPDLLHVHSRRGADLWGGLAARSLDLPCVLARRVDNRESALGAWVKYPLYDRVVAISEGVRAALLASGVDPARITCVRSAIPLPAGPPACRSTWFQQAFPSLHQRGPLVGMVAQLIERKGHQVLFDALASVFDAVPSTQVLLFGQGPLEASLRETLRRRGWQDRVHLLGFRADLDRILPCLDLVVHPALREGLGVAVLQAQAQGLPVVATRAGGLPEAVGHGESGLLVAPGAAGELADALIALLTDPARRRALGQGGRARIARAFSVETMVTGNLAVYEAVHRHRAAGGGSAFNDGG
jgi:glycosyltransferase involved in cell wall biosynthesis